MQRIMIIGQPGAGKSTFARQLGAATGLPVVHIDTIHWKRGWVARSASEKTQLCKQVHAQARWIFEGGHSVTWPERLARADALIWLDLPLAVRSWRVLKRTIRHHGQDRPDLPAGCPERFDWEFAKWIWQTRHSARAKIVRLYEDTPARTSKWRLRSGADCDQFIASLPAELCGHAV